MLVLSTPALLLSMLNRTLIKPRLMFVLLPKKVLAPLLMTP
jgi:hypothetical protein